MAWAGYCDQCRENVWLNADGSCPRGHTADHISGAYQASPSPRPAQYSVSPSQQPQAAKSHVGVVIAVVVAVFVMLFVCGILAAIAIPVFQAARVNAQAKACFANERTVAGASQTYLADTGAQPKTLEDLIDEGLIESEPVCPSRGTYSWDPMTGEIICSVHGSYKTGGREPPTQ